MGAGLTRESRIAALVPHFNCEPYLASCLESLLAQTHPLASIIVLDDGSSRPPVEIVERFPQVTLLHTRMNVGPYRLLQQAISDSDYDGYLFNDADDASAPERLARLLALSEETGAELVGCQAIQVDLDGVELSVSSFPYDVNAALRAGAWRHVFMHGSSLLAHSLVSRLGGYANGLRFGADSEFLRRAQYVATLRNSDYVGYRRLQRPDSLTQAPETGFGSPAREALKTDLKVQVAQNAKRIRAGLGPDLHPFLVGAPIELFHLTGPELHWGAELEPAHEPVLGELGLSLG